MDSSAEVFKDEVALVTGAGRGIGRAVAEALASRGAIVAANDITPIHLDETLENIRKAGGRAKDYIFDVAKRAPVQAMVDLVLEDWGKVDILINSAGVDPHAAILDMDEWDWARTLDVNLSGPFLTMQQVGRFMRQRRSGVIVNLGAAGSSLPRKDHSAFIASKTGLLGLSRAAALEFSEFNVRVNLVCPGETRGGDLAELQPSLKKAGFSEDTVGVILFLCSPAAAGITGRSFFLPGDFWML
jgi:NAD(P)-dependent dehydrogenase (short-subunit alcohol dehydrogenase family)